MIDKIISYLSGEVELYTEAKYRDKLARLLIERNIKSRIVYDADNGGARITVTSAGAKKIASALDKIGIIVYINNVRGLKASLLSRCKRIGVLFGLCIFFTLLCVSTLFVFKVEISGSDKIASEEIRGELADFGIRVGARLSNIDKTAVSNRFLQIHPELSWAAINFKGTTVRLEIKEKSEAQSSQREKYDVLVAECDGLVKSMLVYSGKGAVLPGTVVKKGDLLISGYISGNGLQYTDNPVLRFEGASGSVMAEVSEKISVTVELSEETVSKQKTKQVCRVFSVFGAQIGKNRIEGECEVSAEKNVTIFGVIELPITYREYAGVEDKTHTVVRDESGAFAEAERRAYEELNARLSSGELIRTEISQEVNENGATVTILYTCIRDIAVPRHNE